MKKLSLAVLALCLSPLAHADQICGYDDSSMEADAVALYANFNSDFAGGSYLAGGSGSSLEQICSDLSKVEKSDSKSQGYTNDYSLSFKSRGQCVISINVVNGKEDGFLFHDGCSR